MFYLYSLHNEAILVDEDVYRKFKGLTIYGQDGGNGKIYFKVRVWDSDAGEMKLKRLHRLIMNAPKGMDVDHVNHDYYDLRREALRLATRSENLRNLRHKTTNDRGVTWDKAGGKWRVQLSVNHRYIWGGRFASKREAQLRHRELVHQFHGSFGRPNYVDKATIPGSIQVTC